MTFFPSHYDHDVIPFCFLLQSWAVAVFFITIFIFYGVSISLKPIPCNLFLRQSYLKNQSN